LKKRRLIGSQDLDAYCAGLFDGEGHVSICIRKTGSLQIQISCYNTVKEALLVLQRCYGGKVRACKRRPNRKQSYAWWAWKQDAFFALTKMLPWLIIKRRKAKFALALIPFQPVSGEQYSPRTLGKINMLIGRHGKGIVTRLA
jgi:hypothetical protein